MPRARTMIPQSPAHVTQTIIKWCSVLANVKLNIDHFWPVSLCKFNTFLINPLSVTNSIALNQLLKLIYGHIPTFDMIMIFYYHQQVNIRGK